MHAALHEAAASRRRDLARGGGLATGPTARPAIRSAPVRPPRIALSLASAAALAASATACGDSIDVAQSDTQQIKRGAVLFQERCSGCHTLDAAGAQGSKPERSPTDNGERTNGPNFNQRRESPDNVLYAIRNGGFSGAIMPANIVVGRDADDVAAFVAKYAGKGN